MRPAGPEVWPTTPQVTLPNANRQDISKRLPGYLDESVSSIQVSLNIFAGQDHVNLVVADVASVLRFDDPVVELPKRVPKRAPNARLMTGRSGVSRTGSQGPGDHRQEPNRTPPAILARL
jgi:hypothetical protein